MFLDEQPFVPLGSRAARLDMNQSDVPPSLQPSEAVRVSRQSGVFAYILRAPYARYCRCAEAGFEFLGSSFSPVNPGFLSAPGRPPQRSRGSNWSRLSEFGQHPVK